VDLPAAPDFAAKASRVLDLYQRIFQGQLLGDDEYVLSADEKTSIQARCRCHPTRPAGPARGLRVEEDLVAKVMAFIDDYNRTAKPFRWTYDGRPLKAS
jgi:hypothetical protein